MKYALIADIHANLEALEVVLEDAKKNNCTHYVCLGDVVGYNPNPKECMKIVRDMAMPCIMGNHDEYCARRHRLNGFNPHAGHAITWTRDQLSDEERDWLRRLKYLRIRSLHHRALHPGCSQGVGLRDEKTRCGGQFHLPEHGRLLFRPHPCAAGFCARAELRHRRQVRQADGREGQEYFINVGSVGQPRDGDPRAGYAIYDLEAGTIELRRLEYDFEKTQAKILDAGLPERLANRLALGR